MICAPLIKLTSPGRALFKHTRVGQNGRLFVLYKFRTMRSDAEAHKAALAGANAMRGHVFKMRNDPRVTRVGRVLRRFYVDELPQFWNVLKGDMSLVGPRPLVMAEAQTLTESWQARRADLRPGLTGPWQIAGRSNIPFQEMIRFDYQYVAGWSLARDIEILLATLPAVMSGRGAY
jgi:lipopolysaccharide/colanic/teichoic acid biosynthesis glycosyltransferase